MQNKLKSRKNSIWGMREELIHCETFQTAMDHVDYSTLDKAKNAFIEASKRTLKFAKNYGFVPGSRLGSSANVFSLNLKDYRKKRDGELMVTLLPEGLGTADDARPSDLSGSELQEFWYNIGIKTVSVTTNDAASSGMQTVLLSLYLPSSTPEEVFTPAFMKGFLDGFVEGCRQVGCIYFSGETPQLKNKLYPGKLDIAGALFGVMPPGTRPIDGSELSEGDLIVFVESNGPNENGFTSLRDLASKLPHEYRTKMSNGVEYWKGINNRSILYTPFIQEMLKKGIRPSNIEPITGHGWQKIMRTKKPFRYKIHSMLPVPEVFRFVQKHASISPLEMISIFNYGVGLVIFSKNEKDASQILKIAEKMKLNAIVAGTVEKSKTREVHVLPLNVTLSGNQFFLQK